MANRKQRDQNRANSYWLKARFGSKATCPACWHDGSHYVPPSFGEKGFYTCTPNYDKVDIEHEGVVV
jgi:hypothetical protein